VTRTTLFVFGDQLSLAGVLDVVSPDSGRVLLVETEHLNNSNRHLLRRALYRVAMRSFATELIEHGIEVDYRQAPHFDGGLEEHRRIHQPDRVVVLRPRGRRADLWCRRGGLEIVSDPFWLTDAEWFAGLVRGAKGLTFETFYRHQRRRLGYLMDDGAPCGGRWNYDEENRRPLPRDGGNWPAPWSAPLDEGELKILDEAGWAEQASALHYWPRTRAQALDQLADALERIVPHFGPFEDAASSSNWHLAHSRLSVALNLGLLHPREVADALETHYRAGRIPLASAEGFLRQVIGWREWVAAWHRERPASYRHSNALGATRPLPSGWWELADHPMNCLRAVFSHVREFGWAHHIERLMVLANAATLAGYDPLEVHDWMARAFLDGAEWVMEANVIGMGTFADGGVTATKPYVSGGNYLSRMTDFCRGCDFSPRERTGDKACPLTTLYWQFYVDQADQLARVHRVAPILRAAATREDSVEIARRAPEARRIIDGHSTPPSERR
jgi:deoxyribodipyrimidine photolyase-related protein